MVPRGTWSPGPPLSVQKRETVADAMRSVVSDPTFSDVDRAGLQAVRVETHATKSSRTLDEVITRVKGARAPGPAIEMAERVFLKAIESPTVGPRYLCALS